MGGFMDIYSIENSLKQLKAIDCCRLILDASGEIEEIHITSSSKRNPKQVSRDVQSVLISRFGLEVDYKKISIAQIQNSTEENSNMRLKLKSIEYTLDEMKVNIKVILEKDDLLYIGVSQGPYTANNIMRLSAQACLRAVENIFNMGEMFVLEGINVLSVSDKKMVVIVVNAIINEDEQSLCGSAIIYNDKKEATVKAALDAVNRVIAQIQR